MKTTSIKLTSACWLKGIAPLALVLSLGLIQHVSAQTTVTPDITTRVRPPEERPGDDSSTNQTTDIPLIWGPFTFHPQVFYRYSSTDGLQAELGHASKTDIHTIAPAVSAEFGRHTTLRYAQTWNLYSNPTFRDTVEHAFSAYWNTQYDVWTLNASHISSFTDSPMVETGQQTKQNSHDSSFTALYAMGSHYSLESSFAQKLLFTTYTNPQTWTIREMVHRQAIPQFDTGIGTEYSYTAMGEAADMDTIQFLASINWRPGKRVSLSVRGGLENRRVYSDPSVNVQNPVYTASLQLTPVTRTQLGATASRSTSASFLDGQLSESTQYAFNFQQQLFKRMQFSAVYSRQDIDYRNPQNPTLTARKDKTDMVYAALNTALFTKLRAAITYQHTKNDSNLTLFSFESNQYSIEIGYSY